MSIDGAASQSIMDLDFTPLQFAIQSSDLFNLFIQSTETHAFGSLGQLEKLGGKQQLLKDLRVTINKGLPFESQLDYNSRISAFGSNEIPKPKMKSFFQFIKQQFHQFCIQVLLLCSILVFAIAFLKKEGRRAETFSEAGILFLAVAFVVIIGSVTDFRKEKEFLELLSNQFTPQCVVLRSGSTIQIPVTQLLVGDILILKEGDHVFTDCLLLNGQFLMVDQSSLTGETELVQKTPVEDQLQQNNDPFILAGCNIIEGSAHVLVCSVGVNTQIGSLRKQINSQEFFESLILAEDVNNLAKLLIIIGGCLAVLMFVILFISLIIHINEYKQEFFSEATMLILIKIFMESFLILVLSVPEGLPMIFTLSLAYAVHQMQKQKIIFRKLNACDVMGGCTDIIFDKTGTLSKGKLTVNKIFLFNQTLERYETTEFRLIFNEFAETIALSCQQSGENQEIKSGQRDSFRTLNSNINQTLIKFLTQQTYNYNNIIQIYQDKIVKIIPEHQKSDYNAIIIKITDSHYRCIFKGTPAFIIQNSKYIRIGTRSTQMSVLSSPHKKFLQADIVQAFDENCIQILGFGYYDYKEPNKKVEEMIGELIFLGLVGIHEEYREKIDSLFDKLLNEISIAPRIVTGDQYLMSYKLLNSCKLLENQQIIAKQQNQVMSGSQFSEKIQQSMPFCDKILLIYRATPEQKELLVKTLIESGRIVGYVGDGINDAKALKAADISISMGINAAQIAQENSQVILQDDNLENLIIMLQWGRTIYENIQRFI